MSQKTKSFFILISVCVVSAFFPACQTANKTEVAVSQNGVSTNQSQLKLPALFSDNMVLQQGMTVPIWGWADDGEKITVTFRNQKVSAKAKDGKWKLNLRNLKGGGPDVLTVAGKNKIQLTNVLVGEVWVCSGQSNMEFPLSRSFESKDDIANSANPMIHLFHVPKLKADAPVNDVKANWTECNPQTSASFSAVGYYFGRDLQKARKVPVGLIQSDWGGSPAEAWMSKNVLEKNPRYKSEILDAHLVTEKNYRDALVAFEKNKSADGKKTAPKRAPWKPSELYNGMIAPLIPYAIKGAIWYQGESNAPRAEQYRSLFPDLIRNWRRDWNEGDFTFLAVQLAPFKPIQPQPGESDWAELREAQLLATKILPKVGMAVITDVGEEHDIHPTKKAPVGGRLAVAARGIAYGEKIVFSGPIYKKMEIQNDKAIISFDHVGGGLETRGGALKGFSICGADKKFVWATAEIVGDTVVVSSPNVSKPVAVRYGWADFPVVNLWNKDGLPASPFRTDDFPMITAPKK
ncbi:MAG: sialate O-acetylesterase [Verrucomicrobiota bacterium]|nr:sialate O-acetylesterase [Verrucomicrobiota bacterium]